jgi:hypothetical protein
MIKFGFPNSEFQLNWWTRLTPKFGGLECVGNDGVLVDAEPKNSPIAAVSIDSSCRSGCWSGLYWGAEDFEDLLERRGDFGEFCAL